MTGIPREQRVSRLVLPVPIPCPRIRERAKEVEQTTSSYTNSETKYCGVFTAKGFAIPSTDWVEIFTLKNFTE